MDIRREFAKRTGVSDAAQIERIVDLALDDQVKNQHIAMAAARRALEEGAAGEDADTAQRILDAMLTIYHLLRRLHIDF